MDTDGERESDADGSADGLADSTTVLFGDGSKAGFGEGLCDGTEGCNGVGLLGDIVAAKYM
jgi:hypothetical protein